MITIVKLQQNNILFGTASSSTVWKIIIIIFNWCDDIGKDSKKKKIIEDDIVRVTTKF